MHEEFVYEYIEEADRKQFMELLDAVINRFRELYADQELVVLTLPKENKQERNAQLARIIRLLWKQENI